MLLVECIHIWWSLVQHFLRATDCCAIFANAQLASIPVFLTMSSGVLFSRRIFTVVSERAVRPLGYCEKLESTLTTPAFPSTNFSFHDHKRRKEKRDGDSDNNRKEVKELYILCKILMKSTVSGNTCRYITICR